MNDLKEKYDFVWEDGRHTNISDPLFKPGQFENPDLQQDGCVNIDTTDFYLDDWQCEDLSFFICEKDLVESDGL